MEPIFYFLVFVFGAIVGSFLNVVVFRYNTGVSIVNSRSACMSCNKTLKWFELIPIFSFVIQKGRCRNCQTKISFQYIFVEIVTGFVFLLIFIKLVPDFSLIYSNSLFILCSLLFYFSVFSILIAISVYDLRHKIIPDALVYIFIALSFLKPFIISTQFSIWHFLSGFLIALPFFLLWIVSRGKWMGFGDVKLSLGIGFFLGILGGVYALIWAFWIGGAFSLILLTLKKFATKGSLLFLPLKGLTIKSEIPFGPFLVLGTLISFLFEWDFVGLKSLFNLF